MTGCCATPEPQTLCASSALEERGRAQVFDVLLHGEPARAFALRFDGRVVAFVNRCVHTPAELDWLPGHFLDATRDWIVCSLHGATYDPREGRCVGGPCVGGRLTPIRVEERDGRVCWYPSAQVRPFVFDEPAQD